MIHHQCVQLLWTHQREIYSSSLKIRCKCFLLVDLTAKLLINGRSTILFKSSKCEILVRHAKKIRQIRSNSCRTRFRDKYHILRYNIHPFKGIVRMPPLPFTFNRGLCYSALPNQVLLCSSRDSANSCYLMTQKRNGEFDFSEPYTLRLDFKLTHDSWYATCAWFIVGVLESISI